MSSAEATPLPRHHEESVLVLGTPEQVFAFVDDHARFSAHMGQSSWMMAGSRMRTEVDDGHGQRVGSHIRMTGSVLGLPLALDEVVTEREPPHRKAWRTVGTPRLLVIGEYQMGVEIEAQGEGSRLRVFIDYALPARNAWFGWLFGGTYAKWCVAQMAEGAARELGRATEQPAQSAVGR